MKKVCLFILLAVCGCRSLPIDVYTCPKQKTVNNYRYEFNDKNTSINYLLKEEYQKAFRTDGQKIGKVIISDTQIESSAGENMLWVMPSVFTVGVINLIGWPAHRTVRTYKVRAEVYNNAGKFMNSYSAMADNSRMVAYYYGYNPEDAGLLASTTAYKEALDNVLTQIYNDTNLYNKLRNKTIATEAKKKADIAQKEAQKQKHLNNVVAELDDM